MIVSPSTTRSTRASTVGPSGANAAGVPDATGTPDPGDIDVAAGVPLDMPGNPPRSHPATTTASVSSATAMPRPADARLSPTI